MGKKVVILDADFGMANIEVMFGVIPKYNLSDLLCEGPEGVGFISGGSGIAKMVNLDNDQIRKLVNKMAELEDIADVIIIDTGAGIAPSVMEFLVASPEILLVTTPEPTSITDSYALLKALSMNEDFDKNVTSIKMIANKVSSEMEGRRVYEKLSVVVTKFLNLEIGFIGTVPHDKDITKAIMKQKPVSIMYPNSIAARHYQNIVNTLESHVDNITYSKYRGIKGCIKTIFANRK